MHARRVILAIAFVGAIALACGDGGDDQPESTATPRPVPSPVSFAPQPALDYVRGDPAFEALPGATAHFGSLGGAVYRIEMPENWSGRLLLFMHGSRNFEPELTVDQPFIRNYLIRNGIAWGASSYSSNVPTVADLAINETAALWDYFTQEFGRPSRTYVTGQSLGGISSVISAERFADRYDGAMPMCGALYSDSFVDFFVAGAYVAGVTQEDYESLGTGVIYRDRIIPAMEDPETYGRFQDIVIDLTGGPRPFDREGVDVDIQYLNMWTNSELAVSTRLFGNADKVYELGPASGVSSEEFNEAAIRYAAGPLNKQFVEDVLPTGALQIPVLTLNTTGETRVPLDAVRDLQRLVDAAGKGDLLVQRTVQDSFHCGFTGAEWEQGLEDLIAWVEEGERPDGEDVLSDDPQGLGEEFTLTPRMGSPEANEVPGAEGRLVVQVTATLDGAPLEQGFINATVRSPDGLSRRCALDLGVAVNGRFELPVASSDELPGCGQPGARMFLVHEASGNAEVSQELFDWPAEGNELTVHATFSSADPGGVSKQGTLITGTPLDGAGEHLPPGTLVEAFIGETLCGVSSLPFIWMTTGDSTYLWLTVVGPEAIPACREGETITFRINEEPVELAATHDFSNHQLDLVLP